MIHLEFYRTGWKLKKGSIILLAFISSGRDILYPDWTLEDWGDCLVLYYLDRIKMARFSLEGNSLWINPGLEQLLLPQFVQIGDMVSRIYLGNN